MGEITICFPFFLLLAFLMAAMIAQGKSPLVGFDISVTKPPAEIKSTSYHVKSYDSGGFDTVSKTRNIKGGGTHATRGAGYVANKFAKLGGKIAGKKDWGKEGGFTDNMSKRGALFAISRGTMGGGHVGNIIRDKKAAEQKEKNAAQEKKKSEQKAKETQKEKQTTKERTEKNVKSLRQMLINPVVKAAWVGVTGVASDKKKMEALEKKKKTGKLTKDEKEELSVLTDRVAKGTISGMTSEVERLTEREKNGTIGKEEANRLKSLRTELTALDSKVTELTTNQKKYGILSQKAAEQAKMLAKQTDMLADHAKIAAMLNVREKALNDEVKALDSIGGVAGRLKMAASPFEFAAAGTGLAAKSAYRSLFRVKNKDMKKLKQEYDANKGTGGKEIDKGMTKTESTRLKSLRNRVDAGKPLKDTERKELAQLDRRERYLDLQSGRGTLSAIFNPDKISRKQYVWKSVKGTAYGVGMAAWDSPALRTGRWLHKKYEGRPALLGGENKHIKRLNNASKTLDEIDRLRNDLKKPIGDAERGQKLKEMDKLLGRFEKLVRQEIPGVTHLPDDLIKQVRSGSKHVEDAITDIQTARDELSNSYLQMAALATALNLPKGSAARNDAEKKRDTLNTQIGEQTKKLKEKTNAMKKLIDETYMIREEIKSSAAAKGKMGFWQAARHHAVGEKIAGKASRFYEVKAPETTRAAALGYARLNDFYKSESGSEGSRLGALLKRSFAPFADTQKLKQIEDNMENVQNPTLIEINKLKYEQLRITSQLEGGGKYIGLNTRVTKLNDDIKNLQRELDSTKNVRQNKERVKQLQDTLDKKRTELIKLNKFMKDKEDELERVRNNLNLLLNSFLYQDALSLQTELARKREDNVKGVKEINRELYNDYAERANLEKRMKDTASSKGVSSKEYQELSHNFSKLKDSIDEKVETRKMLIAGSDKETSALKAQLSEASALNKRAMGKEEVVYSDWLRGKMEKQGSPQIGGESGLHREYYELSKLLEISKDKKRLKKEGEKRLNDKELLNYIKGRLISLNSQMYMNEMEMGQSVPFEKALEYDKKFDATETQNKILNASLETRMRDLMIGFDKSELKNDKDMGWTAEVNRLEGFIKENKKKMDEASRISSPYNELRKLKEKHQLAYATGDYGETWKLEEQIKAAQEDLQKKTGISFSGDYREDLKDLSKSEKASNEIALMNRWAKLIMLNNSIDRSIAGEEELAEHRRDVKQRLVRARDVGWAKIRFKERPEVMSKENIVNSLISNDVKDELKAFEKLYSKKSAMQQDAHNIAWEAEKRGGITELPVRFSNESQNQLKSYNDAVKEASKRIKTLEKKKSQYSENQLEYKKIEDQQKEWQAKFRSRYAELKQYKNEFNSLFKPDREKELLQPGSEKKIREHTAEREEEIRNEQFGGSSSRLSGFASRLKASGKEFVFRHGGKALGATAVAAPLLLPFIGPGAVVLSAGAAGGYGIKKLIQERNKPEEYGYPLETGFDAVARDALHGIHLSSHFTGRGSGAPPTTWGKAWSSQMTGAEYITRGFYVDRYGDIQADKQALSVYTEGAPWFIRAFVAPVMPTASTLSSNIRKFTLKMQYHEESKNLARYIMESPKRIPEAQKGINPQYVVLYGAMEHILHPKAAQDLYDYNIFTPYQEQAKNIVVVRKYSSGTALMEGPRGRQAELRQREERMHNLSLIFQKNEARMRENRRLSRIDGGRI
jgi:hypothetical protein